MRTITHAEAVVEAIAECMEEDDHLALVWASVMEGGDKDLAERLRTDYADRVFHPPISEAGLCAIAITHIDNQPPLDTTCLDHFFY